MNNTLTGLGLALVLALLAALIGPWFVNWTAYRDDFAAQASAIVGAPVTLNGAVDARLLPTPYVRFRGLTSGSGATRLAIDEVEVELAIAPLFRGEFKAERLKLVRPVIEAEALADGTVRTALSAGKASKAAPERASFDRAEIVDGTINVATLAGAFAVTRLAGVAEAGSLAGPFKFEGWAAYAGEALKVRLATTRADARGALRAKLAVERRSESLEADGLLVIGARPTFEGKAAIASLPPRAKDGEAPDAWRVTADVKGQAGALRFDNLDAAFGPDDRAIRFGGRGEITLGESPRLDLALDSRQIDLDRAAGDGGPKTPLALLEAAAAGAGLSPAPPFDGRVTLDVRGVVLARDVVQDLRAELLATDGAWRLGRASAILPGGSRAAVSGTPAGMGGARSFEGDLDFATSDLGGLRRWLGGGAEPGAALARKLAVKGALRASLDEIDIDDAAFTADGARSTGHVGWRAGVRDRFEVALVSDRLDLDALGLDRLLAHALKGGEAEAVVALDAKTLVFGGVEMKDVSIDGAIDQAGIELKSLAIRDAGGADISGAGRIAPGRDGAEGMLAFRVAAPDIRPLIALAHAAGAPEAALEAAQIRAAALSPVALDLKLEADSNGRRLQISGDAGGGRLDATLSAAELSLDAETSLEFALKTSEGRRLAALLGLGLSPVSDAGGGEVTARLTGVPSRGMTGDARLSALGVELVAKAAVALAPVTGLSAEGDVTLSSADLTPFGEAIGRLTPGATPRLPASLAARVALSSEAIRIDDLSGEIAGQPIRGRVKLPFDLAQPIDGAIELSEFPASLFAAIALSTNAAPGAGTGEVWPRAPFGPSPARGLVGRLDVSAARMALPGGHAASDATFALALRRNAVAVENLAAALDGGRLSGSAAVTRSEDDATLTFAMQLDGARAERLVGLGAGSAVAGAVDFRIEAQGAGTSLAGIVGAMTGAGAVTLSDGVISRFDAASIDTVEPAVEAGLALEAPRIAEALTRGFDRGDLRLDRATAPFTLSGGVFRAGGISAEAGPVQLGGAAAFDLRRLTLDVDLLVKSGRSGAPPVSVSFEGPLAAPKRRIDATGFTGWLSVRAVERETSRIDAMEADIKARAKVARQRADEARKRADDEKRLLDEERRKAEADKKRESEARALTEGLSRQPPPSALPPPLDLTPPAVSNAARGLSTAPPFGAVSPAR